jgi:hypothetical protein
MDTTTVLEIIKMLDRQINVYGGTNGNDCDNDYSQGRVDVCTELRDHLQSFIEGQLNVAENSTPE